jgi:hypothetical protein
MIQDGKLRGLPWARLFRCGRTIPPARFAGLPSERKMLTLQKKEKETEEGMR